MNLRQGHFPISIALPVHLHFDCGIVSHTGDIKLECSIIVTANLQINPYLKHTEARCVLLHHIQVCLYVLPFWVCALNTDKKKLNDFTYGDLFSNIPHCGASTAT